MSKERDTHLIIMSCKAWRVASLMQEALLADNRTRSDIDDVTKTAGDEEMSGQKPG